MSPWRIIFDAIGWALVACAWLALLALFLGACRVLKDALIDYARDLWDARGEAPRIYDDATYTTFTGNVRDTDTTSESKP